MEEGKAFQPVKTLTKRTFRKNKGRNLVAAAAILMTTLMFTTLFTMAQSQKRNLVEMTFRQVGYDAQVSFKSITEGQAAQIAKHPDVKEVGESLVAGVAVNKKLTGLQVEIRWANDSYAAHSYAFPSAGAMPQSSDEIALDTITLERLGIPCELGQTVTLEWHADMEGADVEVSSFTLSGFWEGNESSYASMAWVSREFAKEAVGGDEPEGQEAGNQMAQVTLYGDRNIEETMDKILSDTGLSDLSYEVNLAYSPEMYASAEKENIPMYLGMILVFVSGYLIIYNIFQISVAADIRFYGKLKTLGTTTRQIRRLIYGQANRLCLMGIPAGLVLGWLLGYTLVPVLMGAVREDAVVSAEPVIFIGSALFAWLTVLISCLRPARLAGKSSPIEALRMSDAAPGGKARSRRNRNYTSPAGMAWANLGRNRKRTVTVICSLTLGLVLLSCLYAKNKAFDIEKYLEELVIADFTLADITDADYAGGYNPQGGTLNARLVEQVEGMEGLEKTGYLYSHQLTLELNEETVGNLSGFYTEDKLSDWAAYDSQGAEACREAIATGRAASVVYGLKGIPLETITKENYLLAGDYDAEKFASGDYVLAIGPALEKNGNYPVLPAPPIGSRVTVGERDYTVMAVVLPLRSVDTGALEEQTENVFFLNFILPYDTFREQWPENTLRRLFFNVDDKHLPAARAILEDYSDQEDSFLPITCRSTMVDQYEAETRSDAVMGNAISLVIALVGILNFANSMITSIVSRRNEFAVIQSVGMTKKQLCGMLVCEGLFYAGVTLAVSYALSALAVGIGVRSMVEGGFTTYRFTLFPLVVCTPALAVFAAAIPFLCFRNLEKQSMVERLRTE